MSLDELTSEVASFAKERDWDQFHLPRSLVLALMAEVGELAEVMQWVPDSQMNSRWTEDNNDDLSEELADVFIYLIRLADVLDIDLESAARSKLLVNAEKYPVEKSRGKSTKYTNL